ncbi:MAE_28990/MAE_18760 family HEPN-like nuclease [Thiothrix nivea]|uniref:RiboL-PSP-HEPN domain-containing protein n=1 Tax=Thiothrix nivea (strain ATCC 35100 / DSM 5205 / JP2) TaxID=870187 RepID=A0A656HJ88_THINJ|nr:MAE_28990/MAE_18760 family HEPN-like nuclease [Thiothrix nivea]EIJ36988.1 hypothetical protein Thini_4517 [Thiothrix nivea DSM 5205]
MKSRQLNSQYQKITQLIKNTGISCGDNIELQGHWGKYICILAAGFLENAISEVYIPLVNSSSSPTVSNFTQKILEKIQNPKSSKFIEIAQSFKKEWGEELELFLSDENNRKDAIDSIMRNRHLIAHGKNTSISVVQVKEFLDKSVEVIDYIETQCGYNNSS